MGFPGSEGLHSMSRTACFTLFTLTLLITHSYMFVLNLTTIEHLSYDRMKRRESILIDKYLDDRSHHEGVEKLQWLQRIKESKRLRKQWAEYWGHLKTESNIWWLDGKYPGPVIGLREENTEGDEKRIERRGNDILESIPWWKAAKENIQENLGNNVAGWFLPLSMARNANGLAYQSNWRFGDWGEWTPRSRWIEKFE